MCLLGSLLVCPGWGLDQLLGRRCRLSHQSLHLTPEEFKARLIWGTKLGQTAVVAIEVDVIDALQYRGPLRDNLVNQHMSVDTESRSGHPRFL